MRLLRYKNQLEPGTIRRVDAGSMREWRRKVVSNLNTSDPRDRGRFRYTHDEATDKTIDVVAADEYVSSDTAVLERPKANKPEEPRVVVDTMVKSTVEQWLHWRRTNPELFRRKVEEAQAVTGMGHLTLDEACDQIEALCRKIEQAEAEATFKQLKIGGGWRGVVLNG